MQELKFEELTLRQKIGMVSCGLIASASADRTDESDAHTLELIRNRELGAIWVNPQAKNFDEIMQKIKETADYPILIFTDAESGLGEHRIGYHNSLGMADNEEYAYTFGKVTAVTARKMGYNVVCNPILDVCKGSEVCGHNVRCIGSDKKRVAKIAAAMARGMHDGGVLTVGKHYPSETRAEPIDPHMAEGWSVETEADLLNENLYPYIALMKEGLLDGIMTGHTKLIHIDNEYPTSLSKKVINVIRKAGFNGFIITDAMSMMGVVAKFGLTESKGLAIEAGNDISLNWTIDSLEGYNAILECFERGILSEVALDAAVRRVLETQHKTLALAQTAEITPEDLEILKKINTDGVYAQADAGISLPLCKDAKHYFVVMTDNDWRDGGAADVATFFGKWYDPAAIREALLARFPNSSVVMMPQYPSGSLNCKIMTDSVHYDDIVFVSYQEIQAYIGKECLTSRVVGLAEAFQRTGRISAWVHFGNPYVLEDLPHIPRIIVGPAAGESVMAAIEVLGGEREAKGAMTYRVQFK